MKTLIGSKNRLSAASSILFAALIILISCSKTMDNLYGGGGGGGGGGGNGGPGVNEVWIIQGMTFTPSTITISAGTTITWTNKDGVSHTVTSDTGLFDSGGIGIGGTYSHKFATAGTFNYHCAVHPSMMAKVIVN